ARAVRALQGMRLTNTSASPTRDAARAVMPSRAETRRRWGGSGIGSRMMTVGYSRVCPEPRSDAAAGRAPRFWGEPSGPRGPSVVIVVLVVVPVLVVLVVLPVLVLVVFVRVGDARGQRGERLGPCSIGLPVVS